MKRKYLMITMLIISSITIVSCSNNISISEDKLLDTIVVDENTKKTTGESTDVEFVMTAKTENLSDEVFNMASTGTDKIIYYNTFAQSYDNSEPPVPIFNLESYTIGTITDDKDKKTNLNKVHWEKKDLKGRVISDYRGSKITRVLNDNKMYKLNNNGDLEEITAYETVVKNLGDNMTGFDSYLNGAIDVHFIGDANTVKFALIDTENNKYYEVKIEGISEFRPLAIEDNKIYASLRYEGDNYISLGYFENNEFTPILTPEDGVNIDLKGGIIYSNGRILFSGYVEDKNGIWNYDVENRKLVRSINIEDDTAFNFSLNKDKDKIILESKDSKNETISIGLVNENLEISNLTSIFSTESTIGLKLFEGWSYDGKSFYLYSSLPGENTKSTDDFISSYEVYKVID